MTIEDLCYDISLTFVGGSESYNGDVALHFDLKDASKALKVDFRSKKISKFVVNGETATLPSSDKAYLELPAKLLRTGDNEVRVCYENAFDHGSSGVFRNVDPTDHREYVFTDFEPFFAHRLIPCFDQPDLKGIFRVHVTAPDGWTAVSNSPEKRAEKSESGVRHEFSPTPRLSTYLLFAGAGPWTVLSDPEAKIPTRILARQSMKKYLDAAEVFEITRRGLAFYQDFFGVAYPFEKYDEIFVPDFNTGAMENPGAITFHEHYLFRHHPTLAERLDRADLLLHEMAHQWFGNLVTMRWWDGLWLNESFATFMSFTALSRATSFTDAFEEFLFTQKIPAYRKDQLPTTHPVSGIVEDTDTALSNFDDITYGKGASLLKQLAHYIGLEQFRKGMKAFFRDHAWNNADTGDFFAALAKAGGTDLSSWRKLHLKTSGVNRLVPSMQTAGDKVKAYVLTQETGTGDGKLRPQKLEVAVYDDTGSAALTLRQTVPVSIDGASTPVAALTGTRIPAFVWPNHGDYAYARFALDTRSLDFARGHLERLDDGLTRRGVWLTLRQMVRDGALAPVEMLETFLAKAPLEKDSKILQGLVPVMVTVVNHYVVARHEEMVNRFEKAAWEQLEKSAPRSDMQRVWFELALEVATDTPSLASLEGILDGKRIVPGLELDPMRRWQIVSRLCAFNRPQARERIAAQLTLDSTDYGHRQALKVEASLPDPKTKKKVWEQCTTDRSMSVEQLRNAAEGLFWVHQKKLLGEISGLYFEVLPELGRTRDPEFVDAFVESFFPDCLHENGVAARAQQFLNSHPDLAEHTRRPLLDALDELNRCLRIRAAERR
ncbi:MAG: aminopeptidase N [Candidatus Wallbacteria bacterium]|nr:aminopeptidase N [Candidatus Wallbacteria bacterium]